MFKFIVTFLKKFKHVSKRENSLSTSNAGRKGVPKTCSWYGERSPSLSLLFESGARKIHLEPHNNALLDFWNQLSIWSDCLKTKVVLLILYSIYMEWFQKIKVNSGNYTGTVVKYLYNT